MKARRLALLLLLYVILTFGSLLGALRFVLGVHDWTALTGAVLWLAYLAGALGLIWGRGWSRGLLLLASVASILLTSYGLFRLGPVAGKTGDPFALALDVLEGILPLAFSVFIFFAILRLKTFEVVAAPALKIPDDKAVKLPSSARVASQTVAGGLKLAYACFALVALGCSALELAMLASNSSDAEGYGMLLVPQGVLMVLGGGTLGLILSVVHWREWPLLVMSAVCLPTVALGVVVLSVPAAEHWFSDRAWAAWLCVVLAILVFFCVRWFFFKRRRATPGPSQATRS